MEEQNQIHGNEQEAKPVIKRKRYVLRGDLPEDPPDVESEDDEPEKDVWGTLSHLSETEKHRPQDEFVDLDIVSPATIKRDGQFAKVEASPERKKRVPLGVPRAKLAVNKRTGYVRRWINDRDGRIIRAKEGGYNFVKSEDAEFVDSDVCNTNTISKVVDSDGTKAFLMEISEQFYEEDQIEKRNFVDRTEEALRKGEDSHGTPGRDGRYIPKEGIKISRN